MGWQLRAAGHIRQGDQTPDGERDLAKSFGAWATDHGITDWQFEGIHCRGNQRGVVRKPAEPAVTRIGEYPADG